jgi:hypothetical protein
MREPREAEGSMTIQEFHEKITAMAMARMGLQPYCDYLQHKTREDKYLREEYLAIQAVVRHRAYPGETEIELGDEKKPWDARIGGTDLLEIVQALPADEHVIRKAVAGGQAKIMVPVPNPEPGEPVELPVTGPLARFLIHAEHAYDHFQFPRVIIEAIEKKHAKQYTDERTLVVVFDGDYSREEDRVVRGWVDEVRQRTHRGVFKEVLLVELARRKVFPLF